jgi:hypothetical protein
MERQAGKPGLAGQINGRQALDDPASQKRSNPPYVSGTDALTVDLRTLIVRQRQRMKYERCRLIASVIRAMPEVDSRAPQSPRSALDEIADADS